MWLQPRDDDGRITITPSFYSVDEKMNEMTQAAYLMEEELKKVTNKFVGLLLANSSSYTCVYRNPGFVGSSADMSRR